MLFICLGALSRPDIHPAANGGKEVLPAIDILLVGGGPGLLIRHAAECQGPTASLLWPGRQINIAAHGEGSPKPREEHGRKLQEQ